jgi:hypothetical protein
MINITPALPNFNEAGLDLDTKIMDLYKESRIFYEKYPEIETAITNDITKHSLDKKQQRDNVKAYEENKSIEAKEVLFDPRLYKTNQQAEPELQTGRPRMMTADMILFFMVLRGHWGSISSQSGIDKIADSMSIHNILLFHGYKCPKTNTIRETLNIISGETHQLILECQARYIIELGMDDFYEVYIDSTHVSANTDFPTDIDITYKLLNRAVTGVKKLQDFGLMFFISSWLKTRLKKINKHLKFVNMNSGKGIKGKVKVSYRKFLNLAIKEIEELQRILNLITPRIETVELNPVKRLALDILWEQINDDVVNAIYVCQYAWLRVNENAATPTKEKILSISDPDAAYICKGQRNPVIGYRPQIARSGNGFITACITPHGNAPDSSMLIETVQQSALTSGVIPGLVSTDDGYSSQKNVKVLQEEMGVLNVSIGGAKGKKLLGDELWNQQVYVDARCNRSAVESGMFTLKYNHKFGQLCRRGIDAVRAELAEKTIAYNFNHIIRVREKRKREQEERELQERIASRKTA